MSERERLVEVMARAICRERPARGCLWKGKDSCIDRCRASMYTLTEDGIAEQAHAAIIAAEREGFRFLGPDDGR